MDTLFIEKWINKVPTAKGEQKCSVYSLWQWHPECKKIRRIAEWVFYPWGGHWEDCLKAWKPAKEMGGVVYKVGPKHSHPLTPASKCLNEIQLEELDFLLQYPERGWANYKKFSVASSKC